MQIRRANCAMNARKIIRLRRIKANTSSSKEEEEEEDCEKQSKLTLLKSNEFILAQFVQLAVVARNVWRVTVNCKLPTRNYLK